MQSRLPLNQHGNGMLVVLMMSGLTMAGLTMSILHFKEQSMKNKRQIQVPIVAEMIKNNLIAAVTSPRSWQVIQEKNPEAFSNQIDPSSPPALDIYLEGVDEVFYRSSNPKAGFDFQGSPCSEQQEFNSTTGNPLCPFHYTVSLIKRDFQNNNWIETVRFELEFQPGPSSVILNPNSPRFTFDLIRNLDGESIVASCVSLNGEFNEENNTCTVKLTPQINCEMSNSYRGPAADSSGSHCEEIAVQPIDCLNTEVIKGFDLDGNPRCGAPL